MRKILVVLALAAAAVAIVVVIQKRKAVPDRGETGLLINKTDIANAETKYLLDARIGGSSTLKVEAKCKCAATNDRMLNSGVCADAVFYYRNKIIGHEMWIDCDFKFHEFKEGPAPKVLERDSTGFTTELQISPTYNPPRSPAIMLNISGKEEP